MSSWGKLRTRTEGLFPDYTFCFKLSKEKNQNSDWCNPSAHVYAESAPRELFSRREMSLACCEQIFSPIASICSLWTELQIEPDMMSALSSLTFANSTRTPTLLYRFAHSSGVVSFFSVVTDGSTLGEKGLWASIKMEEGQTHVEGEAPQQFSFHCRPSAEAGCCRKVVEYSPKEVKGLKSKL